MRSPKLKFVTVLLVALLAPLVVVSEASADSFAYFPNQYISPGCYAYAWTPFVQSGQLNASAYVYCGTNSYGWNLTGAAKNINVQMYQLVTGGWQQVKSTGWIGWHTSPNPLGSYVTIPAWSCAHGRWYATQAEAQVTWNNIPPVLATVSTGNTAWQCP